MSAVLLAVLRPEPSDVPDFYSWYEAEHVTGRLGVPGFTDAHRYRTDDDPDRGILVYELDDLDVLTTPKYKELQAATAEATQTRMGGLQQFVRVTGEVVQEHGEATGPAPLLFVVAFTTPAEDMAELDAWYENEHVPGLLKADAWLGVRLVDVSDSNTGWTRVALHRLADESALSSPERKAAVDTPGRERLAEKPWFNESTRFVARGVPRFDDARESVHG
jgi:hypothetical protein